MIQTSLKPGETVYLVSFRPREDPDDFEAEVFRAHVMDEEIRADPGYVTLGRNGWYFRERPEHLFLTELEANDALTARMHEHSKLMGKAIVDALSRREKLVEGTAEPLTEGEEDDR